MQSAFQALMSMSALLLARSTALYFMYIGPVYSRPAMTSSVISLPCPSSSRRSFFSAMSSSICLRLLARRHLSGWVSLAPSACGTRAARGTDLSKLGATTSSHSAADVEVRPLDAVKFLCESSAWQWSNSIAVRKLPCTICGGPMIPSSPPKKRSSEPNAISRLAPSMWNLVLRASPVAAAAVLSSSTPVATASMSCSSTAGADSRSLMSSFDSARILVYALLSRLVEVRRVGLGLLLLGAREGTRQNHVQLQRAEPLVDGPAAVLR